LVENTQYAHFSPILMFMRPVGGKCSLRIFHRLSAGIYISHLRTQF
jgi:hypothetical protein